jgi:hypothetical protein
MTTHNSLLDMNWVHRWLLVRIKVRGREKGREKEGGRGGREREGGRV